ncbi:MAG: FMN-binding protein [Oscillospiraceae bacterium]
MTRESLKKAAPIFIVAVVAAILVVAVALVTEPVLSKHSTEERQDALVAVMPGADTFHDIGGRSGDVVQIDGAYRGATLIGYCVEVRARGFGGPITMMVGVAHGGNVIGTQILSQQETRGMGDKALSTDFLNQFLGRSGTLKMGHGARDIQAVSGATVSCKGLVAGVNTALAAVSDIPQEGGESVHEPAG